ncbi:Uncharacterized protein dnm_086460 [Desulfonema magnum]|uniref:Uncharacterized protein n=1 Tax=Desulfonema magnum TaxID=45655 RepID=A0A975GTW8_9BACT|nr:Uncharacterized protein dnm_086460 [Desulfonema magnum]
MSYSVIRSKASEYPIFFRSDESYRDLFDNDFISLLKILTS